MAISDAAPDRARRPGAASWRGAHLLAVTELFAPYAPWAGLAGAYALRSSKWADSQGALASAA
jgi:hypothetical protein